MQSLCVHLCCAHSMNEEAKLHGWFRAHLRALKKFKQLLRSPLHLLRQLFTPNLLKCILRNFMCQSGIKQLQGLKNVSYPKPQDTPITQPMQLWPRPTYLSTPQSIDMSVDNFWLFTTKCVLPAILPTHFSHYFSGDNSNMQFIACTQSKHFHKVIFICAFNAMR